MTTIVLNKNEAVERLAEEADALITVLDQVVQLSDAPQALRMGRKGEVLSRAELAKGLEDHKRLLRALDGVPEKSGVELIVFLQHTTNPFLTDPSWHGHPVVAEIGANILELVSLIATDPNLVDPNWVIREKVGHIKDLLQTLQREIEHSMIDDPRMAVGFVLQEMDGVDQRELAHLLGYASDKSLRDLKADRTKNIRVDNDRIVLVAQLVFDLRNAMSPHGMLAWFRRQRAQLDGKSPLDLISDDPAAADECLRSLARGIRGQLAT